MSNNSLVLGIDLGTSGLRIAIINYKKIVIETKHIEAKTELNLIKKNSNILIRLS